MNLDPSKMCFGLSDDIDRQSFVTFLRLIGQKDLAELLAARLSGEELFQFVDSFFLLLRNHLSKEEYHRYFLLDPHHHHKE